MDTTLATAQYAIDQPPRRRTSAPSRRSNGREPDARLLRRLVHGEEAAAAKLYTRHKPAVYRTCQAVLRDVDLAADVTHDVFIEFLGRPGRVDLQRGSIVAYLCIMARRRAIDLIRSRERSRAREAGVAMQASQVQTPHHVLDHAITEQTVREAIDRLPPPQRQVINLSFYEDRTQRYLSSALDIPVGTVKSRKRTALRRLKNDRVLLSAL